MTVEAWATRHRLTAKPGEDGSPEVPGREGSIWEYGAGRLGVSYRGTVKGWNAKRKAGVALGFTVSQNGDDEGNMIFDPKNREQSRFAIRLAGCRPKRTLTPEHDQALAPHRYSRSGHVLTGR